MSEIDTVFDSMGDEGMSAYTVDPASEPHIIIGADRRITVPDELKRLAVQFDHNAETVTFDCPRYWDGTDMFGMPFFINYKLPNGTIGSYIATNIRESTDDPNIIHFDWTIKSDVTAEKGNIIFLVCAMEASTETGLATYHWNTELCKDCFVSEGFESHEEIENENYSLIAELIARVENVGADAAFAAEKAQEATNAATNAQAAADRVEEVVDNLDWYENPNIVNGTGTNSVRQKSASFANGTGSASFGVYTSADNDGQFVVGRHNSVSHDALFVVGAGSIENGPRNAIEVEEQMTTINTDVNVFGNAHVSEDASVSGNMLAETNFEVYNDATVGNKLYVYGGAAIDGDVEIRSSIISDVSVDGMVYAKGIETSGNGTVDGNLEITGSLKAGSITDFNYVPFTSNEAGRLTVVDSEGKLSTSRTGFTMLGRFGAIDDTQTSEFGGPSLPGHGLYYLAICVGQPGYNNYNFQPIGMYDTQLLNHGGGGGCWMNYTHLRTANDLKHMLFRIDPDFSCHLLSVDGSGIDLGLGSGQTFWDLYAWKMLD